MGLFSDGQPTSFSSTPTGFWIVAADGHLLLAGYVYLAFIVLLYAMVSVYVLRCVVVSLFLRDLVSHAAVRMLPFHPDKCGGLRPVGELGLRNQYTLTVLGLNIVLLVAVWVFGLHPDPGMHDLLIAATIAYLILGPIVFLGPLLPFRGGMLRAKAEWSSEVAVLLRRHFDRLREKIRAGQITKTDEEEIDRLRKVGEVIDGLPVWPFDARTLSKFATAYVVPVIPLLGEAVQWIVKVIRS